MKQVEKFLWGTVRAANPFDAKADSVALKKAMNGVGTDEKDIINILGKRSNAQRQAIIAQYKATSGKDLVADVESELSGDFKDTVVALLKKPAQYDAEELKRLIKGKKKEDILEILCTRSSNEIRDIRQEYKTLHKVDLDKDVNDSTSGDFRTLVQYILTSNRPTSNKVDVDGARLDAQSLGQIGEKNWGVNEATFMEVMLSRPYVQLELVMEQYSQLFKKSFEDAITAGMSKDNAKDFIVLAKCAKNMQFYFAERLMKSMKGLGTDDKTLIRNVVTRSEQDLVQIKEEFFVYYNKTLEDYIEGDTSGDYEKMLMTVVHGSF